MNDSDNAQTKEPSAKQTVGLLTCSMAADLDLFALLAETADRHVASDVPHDVVVPAVDVAAFRRFETGARRIIAQEDVLPERIRKLPSWLRFFSGLAPGLRRPLYLRADRSVVRGWMLQQFLKIEMARRSSQDATMHIDSDVGFFRHFSHEDAFVNGKVRYFRVTSPNGNPKHNDWVAASCRFLGLEIPDHHPANYIENCVLWSTATTRAMVERIETTQGKPLYEVLFGSDTMSEYYLYGIFAEAFPGHADLVVEDVSFCNSYWPPEEQSTVDFEVLRAGLNPKHCALAVQSTHLLDISERAQLYQNAERELGHR